MLPAVPKIVFILHRLVPVLGLVKHIPQLDLEAFLLRRPHVLSLSVVHKINAFSANHTTRSVRIILDDAKQIRHAAFGRACCGEALEESLYRLVLRHVRFFGGVGCFGDGVFDLEVVGVGRGPAECDLQGFVEICKRCVGRAGERAEDLRVADVVRTEVDFQEVVLAFADAFVGAPVCGLAVFGY